MREASKNLVVKIILASVLIILVPVAINKLLLKEVFQIWGFDENTGRALRGILSGVVISPLLYVWFYSRLYREKLAELEFGNAARGILGGVLLASLVLLPVIIVFRIFGIITSFEYVQPQQFWYGAAMILVLAATEELFFRGVLYKIIEARYSWPIAILVTAFFFTASHLTNDNFTVISVLSVVAGSLILGLLFTWGRSLWMPVAFHFSWNMIQALMGLSVSGLSLFPGTAMFKVEMAGSALLTGGDFGLENSLPVIFLLLAISFFLISRIRNSIGKDTGKGIVSVSAIL